jgi:DNA-binding response OmpR family regulator
MSGRSVLIVDDEKNIRFTLSMALEELNLSVDTAVNGEEALHRLSEKSYALILLDLHMPGIPGLEVLRRVAAIRPEAKVIIITAYGTMESAIEAMKLGAVDFLPKPFDPAEVREMVSRLLSQGAEDSQRDQEYAKYFALALARTRAGEFDAAHLYVHKAIAIDPEGPEAFNLLGGLCEAQGDRLQADKNYRAALALDASYKPAQRNQDRITRRPYTQLGIDWGYQTGKNGNH